MILYYICILHEGGLRRKCEKEPVQAVSCKENYSYLTKYCMVRFEKGYSIFDTTSSP